VLWVVLLLIVGPIVELWVILQTADLIGGWQTLGLLLIEGAIGGWLMKRQGRAVVRRVDERLRAHDLPTKDLADGLLILSAGALMLTPGFVTDIVGFGLLLPPTRAVARRALLRRFSARMGQGFAFVPEAVRRGRPSGGSPVVDTTATEAAQRRSEAAPLRPGSTDGPSGG